MSAVFFMPWRNIEHVLHCAAVYDQPKTARELERDGKIEIRDDFSALICGYVERLQLA